ncbi:MAG: tyrosine-protein phosphatase [Acetobacteraceae bacterium]
MTERPPRALVLQGASNVRDLGGWPTEDGGRVRFGHVFRSAALTGLTEDDALALAGTGLRTVCDLRGRQEAAEAPSALGGVAGATVHSLPIEPSVGASLRDLVATRNATGENVMAVMRQAYVAYALEWPHRYRAIFALLADDAPPLLLHCSAGKDRTGFGAALILTALGVPYEAVREDYLASNRLWRGDAGIARDLPPGVAETLLRVHPELLDAAFAAIAGAYGGFARYASLALEMDAARLAHLRARLVE